MELPMIDLIYAALPMHAQTEKTTFSCKDLEPTLTKKELNFDTNAAQFVFHPITFR